jgi:hypothetical protein
MKTVGWHCVKRGLLWALREGWDIESFAVHAIVQRQADGYWRGYWRWDVISVPASGYEPSRETAMSAADAMLAARKGGTDGNR